MASTPANTHIRCVKPQLVRRYAAYAFDWTLVALALELLPTDSVVVGLMGLIVLGAAYFSLMEASPYQGTLGKWLVGLRVEDEAGDRLEITQSVARFFAGAASWATLNIGHMMAGWRPDGRALHDLVAKTRVCQERNLEAKHNAAVVVFLLIHAVSLAFAVWVAVEKMTQAINQALQGGALPMSM